MKVNPEGEHETQWREYLDADDPCVRVIEIRQCLPPEKAAEYREFLAQDPQSRGGTLSLEGVDAHWRSIQRAIATLEGAGIISSDEARKMLTKPGAS